MDDTPQDTSEQPPTGWFRVPNALIEHLADIGPLAGVVYIVLAKHRNNRSGDTWLSQSSIAELIGVSDRSVRTAVRKLELTGLLDTKRRKRDTLVCHIDIRDRKPASGQRPQDRKCTSALENQDRKPASSRPEKNDHQTGSRLPPNKTIEQDSTNKTQGTVSAGAGAPAELLAFIDDWNELGSSIVKPGNGVRRDPPAKAILKGWAKVARERELSDVFADIPRFLNAIRGAKYCHGQGWFTLPWLFGKNRDGEFKAVKLVNGGYTDANGNGQGREMPTGAGHKHGTGEVDAASFL